MVPVTTHVDRAVAQNYPRNEDTSLIRTFSAVLIARLSVKERFHCLSCRRFDLISNCQGCSIEYDHLFLCNFSHYFIHGGWLPENSYILDNVDKIRHIPATIIQGRYDVTTPMRTAWELHKVTNTIL